MKRRISDINHFKSNSMSKPPGETIIYAKIQNGDIVTIKTLLTAKSFSVTGLVLLLELFCTDVRSNCEIITTEPEEMRIKGVIKATQMSHHSTIIVPFVILSSQLGPYFSWKVMSTNTVNATVLAVRINKQVPCGNTP